MRQQLQQAACSMSDPQLHTPLLGHPSIAQNWQVVAKLLQTSKELQAAAATVWVGQQQVVLHTGQVQQAESFAQWLGKYAGLLHSVDLHVISSIKHGGTRDWEATTAVLAGALQDAAEQDILQALRCFSDKGSAANAGVLQALKAAQLTQLAVELHIDDYPAIDAVTALTSLCSLDLKVLPAGWCHRSDLVSIGHKIPVIPEKNALAPLAALPQLTQLHIGPVFPGQLQQLPPALQQLHVTVNLGYRHRQLLQFAGWVRQYGSLIRTLELIKCRHVHSYSTVVDWQAAADALAAAFEVIAAAATAQSSAAAGAVAATPMQQVPADGRQPQRQTRS
jgi:hypothetical protein